MNDYLNNLKNNLFKIIDDLIDKNIIDKNFDKNNISLDYFSKSKKANVSSNILILLKNKIKDNFQIEDYILENIKNLDFIYDVFISKGNFINVFFKEEYILDFLSKVFISPSNYGESNEGKNKKINVEFVSANPTGPIHIAHIRGAVFGDVISSIYEATGYDVTREYYVNDSGTQIKILGNSLFKRYSELFDIEISFLDNEYPGKYLILIAKIIKDKDGNKWLNYDLNKREKYFEKFAVDYLVNKIEQDLNSINIKFNKFTYESDIIKKQTIDEVFAILKEKNLLFEGYLDKPKGEEKTNWKPKKQLLFKSSKFNDDQDRAIKKENGDWTYFANDAAYHYDKFKRNYFKLINVWGADHIGYINRMKSIVEVCSNQNNYLDVQICQLVRLISKGKTLKMSKREGNFVTLKELLDKVGKDSIRYYMISTKNVTPMDFNLDKVVEKNKDNQVFYCQYAYARASSVINKSKNLNQFENFENNFSKFNYNSLSPYEKEIILKIISWPYLLNQSSYLRQPHKIINYIEDISSSFHSFWNMGKNDESLRMLDSSNIEKTTSKLFWVQAFRIVMKKAFDIIGIEAIENM